MLVRTGLMDHVCQLRRYLMKIKHNVIAKVCQKAMHKVEVEPGTKVKIKVRVAEKEVTV